MIGKISTCCPVRVVACTNNGGVTATGRVDVIPLVNQVSGAGFPTAHGIVKGIPYCRIQAGTSAVILDPVPGDVGVVVFAQRDISNVLPTGAQVNPGSFRQYDWADGIYISASYTVAPTSYINLSGGNISIVTPNTLSILAANINSAGTWSHNGTMTVQGTNIHTHVHGGVQSGSSNTGAPI